MVMEPLSNDQTIRAALYTILFIVMINVAAWTGVSIKRAVDHLIMPPPVDLYMPDGAVYTQWADGRQEWKRDRNGRVKFLPTDDPRIKE
jgi:hypothetical protein